MAYRFESFKKALCTKLNSRFFSVIDFVLFPLTFVDSFLRLSLYNGK